MRAEELFKKINEYYIVDVRSREEYLKKHIPNAINIPYWDMEYYVDFIKELRLHKKVILYCNRGLISGYARKFLKEKGMETEVLTGGLISWVNKNLPTVKGTIVAVDEIYEIPTDRRGEFEKFILNLYLKVVVAKGLVNFRVLKHEDREYHLVYYWKSIENYREFRSSLKDLELATKYVPKEVKVMEVIV